MNRLIIVGNGFDLAHGLKTSYCDFLDNYLKSVLEEFYNNASYDDPLMNISHYASQNRYRYPYILPVKIENVHEYLAELRKDSIYDVSFKSDLLSKSLDKSKNLRWVDLENDFFDELLSCLNKEKSMVYSDRLLVLNNQFGYLKNKLESYLLTVQIEPKNFKKDLAIQKVFDLPIDKNDVLLKKINTARPHKTIFLNFNYTNTLVKYASTQMYDSNVNAMVFNKKDINYIHGELGSRDNKIIFGFGDEYDDDYLKFETLKNNNLFHHIKSFSYFKTRNYHELIRFLNADEFQVFIIGHSCGLSDRTMFRKIFEHSNCLSIKIFYHKRTDGSTDYVEKTYDLARHFTNKGDMREKIVSEPNSNPLPQYQIKS